MKRILGTVTLSLAIALAGCATTQKFEAKMNGFVGKSESAVIGAYGAPNSNYTMTDGSRVISYTRGGTSVIPGSVTTTPVTTNTTGNMTLNQGVRQTTGAYTQQSTAYVQERSPDIKIQTSCTVNFIIDQKGIVQSWSASGNRCVAD